MERAEDFFLFFQTDFSLPFLSPLPFVLAVCFRQREWCSLPPRSVSSARSHRREQQQQHSLSLSFSPIVGTSRERRRQATAPAKQSPPIFELARSGSRPPRPRLLLPEVCALRSRGLSQMRKEARTAQFDARGARQPLQNNVDDARRRQKPLTSIFTILILLFKTGLPRVVALGVRDCRSFSPGPPGCGGKLGAGKEGRKRGARSDGFA